MDQPGGHPAGQDDALAAARRRAGIVAAVAGLGLVPYFLLVGTLAAMPVDEAPPVGAPEQDFVDFYRDNFSEMPLNVTLTIGMWVILLVLIVAVVRAACRRFDLAAILAVTLAGAATVVFVVAEGILAWPVVLFDMTPEGIRDNLDPGVAQAMVLSRDGIHATAIVLLQLSMFLVAWLLLAATCGPLAAGGGRRPGRDPCGRPGGGRFGRSRARPDPPVGDRRRRGRHHRTTTLGGPGPGELVSVTLRGAGAAVVGSPERAG